MNRQGEHLRSQHVDEFYHDHAGEEFFRHVDIARTDRANLGIDLLDTRQFSALSWGISVRKPEGQPS